MIEDARTLAAGTRLQADICVIGAGPAGTTLALELAELGRDVLLLEAGGLEDDPDLSALAAPASGFRYGSETEIIQHLRFGGNANSWHVRTPSDGSRVRFAAFQDADFEAREETGNWRWPFRAADLRPAEHRAGALWGLAPAGFGAPEDLPQPGGDLDTASYQFPSARKVTKDFRDRISRSKHITLLTHALVHRLEFEDGRATQAHITPHPDHPVTICAGTFVVASGALGACRLLFNSPMANGDAPGNQGDALGRYLMDHPGVLGGVFYPSSPAVIRQFIPYDICETETVPAMAHMVLSNARLRAGGVLGLASQFFPRSASWRWDHVPSFRRNDAVLGIIAARRALEQRRLPSTRHLRHILAGLDAAIPYLIHRARVPQSSMARGGWSQRPGAEDRYAVFEVVQSAEQAPHRDNRVLPSEETDALGHRRITLDWQLHEPDIEKIIAAQEVFEAGIAASGLGRIDHARPGGTLRLQTTSSHHHIGGLRMGSDPATSVTNANGRVHGTDNLYVAGSGLFPTGSYANPTWLIAVLAVRLAVHLAGRISPPAPPAPSRAQASAP